MHPSADKNRGNDQRSIELLRLLYVEIIISILTSFHQLFLWIYIYSFWFLKINENILKGRNLILKYIMISTNLFEFKELC